MTNVSARFKCDHITDYGSSKEVKFSAVYSNDKTNPNYTYSLYTPSGSLSMMITNPAAYDQFKPGKIYDLAFTEYVEPTKT